MSGIAGLLFLDGRAVEGAELRAMLESVAHRGPDGGSAWSEGAIGLGHRLLATTPESVDERQPIVRRNGELAVTADARIDNREELLASLGLRRDEEIGDAELILAAYERWGERCPERLVGDFAFAVWDRRLRRLFCARDHFGVKPLYYHHSGRLFAFGSEIKTLLSLADVPRRLNEERVADYLASLLEDRQATFYRGVSRLPAGHALVVDEGRVRLRRYWTLDPRHELRLPTDEDYEARFRELFLEAVRSRLRSAFPVGSMLSGGLDSSAIACAARGLLGPAQPLNTFSAIFDDVPECDERRYIDAALAGGGLEPHYVHADRLGPLADLDRVLWHADEPVDAPNLFMHRALYGSAERHGVRVLLDGLDGDTTVSHGLAYLTELARAGRWVALARSVASLSARSRLPARALLRRRLVVPVVPEAVRRARRRAHGGGADLRLTIVNRELARRVGLEERLRDHDRARSAAEQGARHDHWRRLTSGSTQAALEVADRAAAAFSLEPRYPFFDRRLAEFCLALPAEQKLGDGWTRRIMRRALGGVLPEEIRWRPGKSDLSPNFVRGLLRFERAQLDALAGDRPRAIDDLVESAALRAAYAPRGSADGEAHAVALWKIASLDRWLRLSGLCA